MKICAIICEYNPFHNGHKYLIERARELSDCDAVLCLMSASFTQRGDAAILPKFLRAEHAIKGGADCVIQLPTAFSVAPAEIFAQGAISILKSIPSVTSIAFGCENADVQEINRVAELLHDTETESNESRKFADSLLHNMEKGQSYKRGIARTLEAQGADSTLVTSPNGVLALEYARAIKKYGAAIELIPVQRIGGGYGDGRLHENFSSASAIRVNLKDDRIANNVPPYVFKALTSISSDCGRADVLYRYALACTDKSKLTRIFGCTEGLENKITADLRLTTEEIIANATSKRYTSSRIRRIIVSNLLGLYADETKRAIAEGTYIKPLAVRKELRDKIFSALSEATLPIIIKKMSLQKIYCRNEKKSAAQICFEADVRADLARALIYGENPEYDFTVKII